MPVTAIKLNGQRVENHNYQDSSTASKIANGLTDVAKPSKNLTLKADGVVLRGNAIVPNGTKVIEVVDVSNYEWSTEE